MTGPALARIGHCEIDGQLGAGGMGVVYRGHHALLGHAMAVKLLNDDLAHTPGYVDRFLREARAAAGIKHPNVVQVSDAGEENGKYFIAMELVEGTDLLEDLKQGGAIPVGRARHLLRQVASGLAAAHALGLIHRDIKPENLLLARDGTVKISDFGLAKSLLSETRLTQTGIVLGTPAFMSPEQCEGRTLTAASDIYSLGATFFYLVTGHLPFKAERVGELLLKHMESPAPYATEVNPEVDEQLSDLLVRMMAKRPAKRFRDAGELLAWLDHPPVEEAEPAPKGQPWLWVGLAAGVLLGGLGWWGLSAADRTAVGATVARTATEPASGGVEVVAAGSAGPAAGDPATVPEPERPVAALPADAPGCANAGVERLGRGDLDGAEAAFRRALELGGDPGLVRQADAIAAHRAAVATAEKALVREDWDGAQQAFEQAMRGLWVDATEERLARIRRFRGLLAKAEEHLTGGSAEEAERAFGEAREVFDTPLLRVRHEAAREARRRGK